MSDTENTNTSAIEIEQKVEDNVSTSQETSATPLISITPPSPASTSSSSSSANSQPSPQQESNQSSDMNREQSKSSGDAVSSLGKQEIEKNPEQTPDGTNDTSHATEEQIPPGGHGDDDDDDYEFCEDDDDYVDYTAMDEMARAAVQALVNDDPFGVEPNHSSSTRRRRRRGRVTSSFGQEGGGGGGGGGGREHSSDTSGFPQAVRIPGGISVPLVSAAVPSTSTTTTTTTTTATPSFSILSNQGSSTSSSNSNNDNSPSGSGTPDARSANQINYNLVLYFGDDVDDLEEDEGDEDDSGLNVGESGGVYEKVPTPPTTSGNRTRPSATQNTPRSQRSSPSPSSSSPSSTLNTALLRDSRSPQPLPNTNDGVPSGTPSPPQRPQYHGTPRQDPGRSQAPVNATSTSQRYPVHPSASSSPPHPEAYAWHARPHPSSYGSSFAPHPSASGIAPQMGDRALPPAGLYYYPNYSQLFTHQQTPHQRAQSHHPDQYPTNQGSSARRSGIPSNTNPQPEPLFDSLPTHGPYSTGIHQGYGRSGIHYQEPISDYGAHQPSSANNHPRRYQYHPRAKRNYLPVSQQKDRWSMEQQMKDYETKGRIMKDAKKIRDMIEKLERQIDTLSPSSRQEMSDFILDYVFPSTLNHD